jgi:hypothetical protein
MCFGSNIVETQTRQELPPFIEEAAKRLLSQTEAITGPSVQYTPYGGERLAPLTTEQQLARQAAIQQSQAFRPDLNTARALGLQGTGGITGADIERFRSPYIDNVMRTTLDELERRNQISSQRLADQAVKSGAFGGARFGVQQAEQERNLQQQQARTATQLAQQNYDQALRAAQAQKAQQLSGAGAFGTLAGQGMQLGQQGIAGLRDAGLLGQQQLQRGMDIAYQDFLRQQQFPYTQAATLGNLLSGVPAAQMVTGYSQQPGPSMAQQLAGLGAAAVGLGNL